jgi:hypothetical protein
VSRFPKPQAAALLAYGFARTLDRSRDDGNQKGLGFREDSLKF